MTAWLKVRPHQSISSVELQDELRLDESLWSSFFIPCVVHVGDGTLGDKQRRLGRTQCAYVPQQLSPEGRQVSQIRGNEPVRVDILLDELGAGRVGLDEPPFPFDNVWKIYFHIAEEILA